MKVTSTAFGTETDKGPVEAPTFDNPAEGQESSGFTSAQVLHHLSLMRLDRAMCSRQKFSR